MSTNFVIVELRIPAGASVSFEINLSSNEYEKLIETMEKNYTWQPFKEYLRSACKIVKSLCEKGID